MLYDVLRQVNWRSWHPWHHFSVPSTSHCVRASTPELTCGQYQKRPKPVIFVTISTSWKSIATVTMFCKGEQIGNPEKIVWGNFNSIFTEVAAYLRADNMRQKSTKWKEKKVDIWKSDKKPIRFWANDKAALVWLRNTIWRNIAQDGFLVSNLPWTPV